MNRTHACAYVQDNSRLNTSELNLFYRVFTDKNILEVINRLVFNPLNPKTRPHKSMLTKIIHQSQRR